MLSGSQTSIVEYGSYYPVAKKNPYSQFSFVNRYPKTTYAITILGGVGLAVTGLASFPFVALHAGFGTVSGLSFLGGAAIREEGYNGLLSPEGATYTFHNVTTSGWRIPLPPQWMPSQLLVRIPCIGNRISNIQKDDKGIVYDGLFNIRDDEKQLIYRMWKHAAGAFNYLNHLLAGNDKAKNAPLAFIITDYLFTSLQCFYVYPEICDGLNTYPEFASQPLSARNGINNLICNYLEPAPTKDDLILSNPVESNFINSKPYFPMLAVSDEMIKSLETYPAFGERKYTVKTKMKNIINDYLGDVPCKRDWYTFFRRERELLVFGSKAAVATSSSTAAHMQQLLDQSAPAQDDVIEYNNDSKHNPPNVSHVSITVLPDDVPSHVSISVLPNDTSITTPLLAGDADSPVASDDKKAAITRRAGLG